MNKKIQLQRTQHGSTAIFVATFLTLIVVGTGIYVLGNQHKLPVLPTPTPVSPSAASQQYATTSAQYMDPATWKSYTIQDANLSFKAPPDMTVTHETQKDQSGAPYSLTMVVQRGQALEPDYYQLYGVYQFGATPEDDVLEAITEELVPESVAEATVSGISAVSGQIKGERNRFLTAVATPRGLFRLLTAEPTEENRTLTESILSTFVFAQ